jgi:putative endonuclease
MYYFYILRCKDKTLYSGIAKDIKRREQLHNLGKGSKYVYARGGGKIIYFERFKTLSRALKREIEVKKWPRIKKLNLTRGLTNKKSHPR